MSHYRVEPYSPRLILGLESSCDETAAAVVRDGREVLSSVVHSQIASHRPYGGVVPEIASREHVGAFPVVAAGAVERAGVSWADLDAIAWIDQNLPRDARFLINTTEWGHGISRGVDGGAWILPLTGRWTVAPTLFYTFGEDLEQVKKVMDWGKQAQAVTGCSDALWRLIDEASLTHIYTHDGIGRLSAPTLATCPGISQVYLKDGVGVWEITR